MNQQKGLRRQALSLFERAVDAANPARALKAALLADPPLAPSGRLLIVAIGKAALPMIREAIGSLPPDQKYEALAVTNYENGADVPGAQVLVAGHPVPDANGAIAAKQVMELLKGATAQDQVLALISGGASALLPAPSKGITLEEKITLSEVLLKSGFEIHDLNLVRQQLSDLKGGGLTRLAAPARVKAYILSDVIGDDLRVIASGPTVSPIGSASEALKLLRERQLQGQVPKSILKFLETKEPAQEQLKAENVVIGSNHMSLLAMERHASEQGWDTHIISTELIGDVEDAAQFIANQIQNVPPEARQCLIAGGETIVNVRGDGIGGRNQELALRVSLLCQDIGRDWVFLSGGTDGRDGPTAAAGGIVGDQSAQRMKAAGVDPHELLLNSDSFHALEASDDLIPAWPTGTNVADIQIALVEPKSPLS